MKDGNTDLLKIFAGDRDVRKHLKRILGPEKLALLIAEQVNPHMRLRQKDIAFLAGVTVKTIKNQKE